MRITCGQGGNHGIMCYGKKGFDKEAENDCSSPRVYSDGR